MQAKAGEKAPVVAKVAATTRLLLQQAS